MRNSFFIVLLPILFLLQNKRLAAQEKYWVSFYDKAGVTFDPFNYFSRKAIERKIRYQVPLADKSDYPVNKHYIDQVKLIVDSVSYQSRWLNGLAVYAKAIVVADLLQLPCVKRVEIMMSRAKLFGIRNDTSDINWLENYMLEQQLEEFELSYILEHNLTGRGVRIAIFDAGFKGADKNPAFAGVWKNENVKNTYDFVLNRPLKYKRGSHGSHVWSCIGGLLDTNNIADGLILKFSENPVKLGLATESEYLLARVERNLWESYSEEENWLAAAEWADKNGVDIINSSLGYTYERYFKENMDGKTSLVSRAASMAARKGILVINAAGNDGTEPWKTIGAPADVDSVLSVGGVNSYNLLHLDFSSYGPTADDRLKPNVCAIGETVVFYKGGLEFAFGTSFSAPLVTGFAACMWEQNRSLTAMQMHEEIQKSGHLYPYFDYAHGYGIPKASKFVNAKSIATPSFSVEERRASNVVAVNINATDLIISQDIGYGYNKLNSYLYYHVADESGQVEMYEVILVYKNNFLIPVPEARTGKTIRIHYRGTTNEIIFK